MPATEEYHSPDKIKTRIHRALFSYGFIGLCFSLPFNIQINSLIIIILAANYVLEGRFRSRWEIAYHHPLCRLLALFYLIYILTLFNNTRLSEGSFQLELKFSILFFPLLLVEKCLSQFQVNRYLRLFTVACFLSSVYCLGYSTVVRYQSHHFNPLHWNIVEWTYFSFTLANPLDFHPTYYSAFMNISLFITVYFGINNWKKYSYAKRTATILFIAYQFVFITLLAARTPFLAGLVVMVVSILMYGYQRKYFFLGLLTLFCLVAAVFVLYNRVPYLKEKIANQYGVGQRYQVWKASSEILQQHWLLGVGAGDVRTELLKRYEVNQYKEGLEFQYDPHNQYLETWLSTGIVGIALLLLFLGVFLTLNWKNHNYLGIACIVFLAFCWLTESMLETQKGVVLFTFITSLFASQKNDQVENK